ncbi:hypothetical protein J7E25_06865 [Agromyces sp. ISL-38]|uniref:hypothetical protein n=1 Tax=Agromyces sp. ISL-38 TaxID=2819107 RepID=UPI001BE889CB|nr:hypothetical protein [Agromyces sp. ISL-38]MBT2498812.1 hypothetical protein [Agromyces sp. ISL-38]MBT2516503.1 hypothetical protein [Streptomyces sp. ISL-90]
MTAADERTTVAVVTTRAAAGTSSFLGLGFGIPGVIGAAQLERTGRIWKLMGYPTYGPGEFAEWGVPTTVPLILGFAGVCAAEVAVGTLLWRRKTRKIGRILALVLLPIELVFWIGFRLPFGPPLGAARTALVITGWIAEPRKR